MLILFAVSQKYYTSARGGTNISSQAFQVIVLTMNRPHGLSDLLNNIESTDYDGDRVDLVIRIDHSEELQETLKVAKKFKFSFGKKSISVSRENKGLAQSWFDAWNPISSNDRAVILEDDIILSPGWYKWLKQAWNTYEHIPDLAGISLQRQQLVPMIPWRDNFTVDEEIPFLYNLLGSIGYSPNPMYWQQFRSWIQHINLVSFDASTPGLVTSEWWNTHDKRQMWTQHFIYFCVKLDLYTLYARLPQEKTIAAHMRYKGAHIKKTMGADFQLATSIPLNFPDEPQRFAWNGVNIVSGEYINEKILMKTLFHTAARMNVEYGFVYLMFLNAGFLHMTKNWLCDVLKKAPNMLNNTIFISSDISTTRALNQFYTDLHIFTRSSQLRETVSYGSFTYYKVITERMLLQNELLQQDVNVQIIESDQFWSEDITAKIRLMFQQHDVFGGQEGDFPIPNPARICGGFYGVRATKRTKKMFAKYVRDYVSKLDQRSDEIHNKTLKNINSYEDDQAAFTRIAEEAGIKVTYMDRCFYANGLWFKKQEFVGNCSMPSVIHNGYIVGNDAKIQRAKETHRWFLHSNNKECIF